MKKIYNLKNILPKSFYYLFLISFSFSINFWTASRGVFPIDTFVHFDSAFRITIGEHPIKDFWIVHGLLVDYIQAIFFKIFGANWISYALHASFFNVLICVFSFKIFLIFKLDLFKAFLLSLCVATMAYPVSGTPFLDLHSTYFALFAIYFLILAINKNNDYFIYLSVLFFGFAFICKQVPAGYTILGITSFLIYYCLKSKKFSTIKYSLLGIFTFFILLIIFLFVTKIDIKDLFFQLIIFPSSIAQDRFSSYDLNFNNIFLDFKFIYFFLFISFFLLMRKFYLKKKFDIKKLDYFLILVIFTISLIYHQIYTKNQIFIFFIIPILCSITISFLDDLKDKKNYFEIILIIICVLITIKYHNRFNVERKFHELSNTNISNVKKINLKEDFFKGLNWITPNFNDASKEIDQIKNFYAKIKLDSDNKILITNYTFFSALTNQKLYSPSRTFDEISYPQLGSKYFDKYEYYFRKNIIKNKIKKIYVFYTQKEIDDNFLKMIILDYLPKECLSLEVSEKYMKLYKIENCKYLKIDD